jgi:ribonuclease HI
MEKELSIYTDGGARGNPGPAAIGIVFYNEKKHLVARHKKYLGPKTNNQAEYLAVIEALRIAKKHCVEELIFHLDSELVCRQLTGEYKIKNPELKKLHAKAKALENSYSKVTYKNVPRENPHIQEADALVNETLDAHS